MKKLLLILMVIAIIVAILGIGLGIRKGTGDGDGKNKVTQEETETAQNDAIKEQISVDQNDDTADAKEEVIIKINVVGNEYFYENERISLDDFISKVKEIVGDVSVEVKDDNASLKAYNNLTKRLKELKIPITEK